MLYVASKRGLPQKCARFVRFRPIIKRSFSLLCVLDLFSELWQSAFFQNFFLSCICLSMSIMSTVPLLDLNPHWLFVVFYSAIVWMSLFSKLTVWEMFLVFMTLLLHSLGHSWVEGGREFLFWVVNPSHSRCCTAFLRAQYSPWTFLSCTHSLFLISLNITLFFITCLLMTLSCTTLLLVPALILFSAACKTVWAM